MDCKTTSPWIWEVLEAPAEPPARLAAHLASCADCRAQFEARLALDQDLRELRMREQEEPSESVNCRVLGALPGVGPSIDRAARGHLGLVSDAHLGAEKLGSASSWRTFWQGMSPLLALSAALAAAVLLGFNLGQLQGPPSAASPTPALMAQLPRVHQVGLSERALQALEEGNTYMLIGPHGGPYQIIDVTRWEGAGSVGPTPMGRDELLLVVGPAGGWSRGKTVLIGDLAGSGAEILARRALSL
ncbi:MAG: hypothetical protein CMP23_03930 [Rickettsiales bacterium]|nr:hypothetical protein [Rickettsiales bacterium]